MFKKYTILFVLGFFLTSCFHTARLSNSIKVEASREKTWESLVSILKAYPIKIIDQSNFYMKTETFKGEKFWKAPHQQNLEPRGLKYFLEVRVTGNKSFSQVEIIKTIYKQKSFFSTAKKIPSDLLEEHSLLYRLKRELYILETLKTLNEK